MLASLILFIALTPFALLTFSSTALAAECPNEHVREESKINPSTNEPYSTQLPDCRAYELVSPPDTGGFPVTAASQSGGRRSGVTGGTELYQVMPGGTVFFVSQAAPPETGAVPNGRAVNVFTSTRSPRDWVTTDLTPFSTPNSSQLVAGAANGTAALILSEASLVPDDQDNPENEPENVNAQDLYVVHESGQAPELVSKGPLPRTPTTLQRVISNFISNPELSSVAFISQTPLEARAAENLSNCYTWTDVGSYEAGLIGSDEHGDSECTLHAMTPEGRPVYVDESGDRQNGALLVGGAGMIPPVQISGTTPFAATYDGISPDDRVAYVTTLDQLQEGAGVTGPTNVYAVDVPKFPALELSEPPQPSDVTCISCGHSGSGATFLAQSADGSHIFFSSSEGLWSWDAQTGEANELSNATNVSEAIPSENGEYLIGLTSQLAGNPHGTADVYEFTASQPPELVTSGESADTYSTAETSTEGYPSIGGVSNDGRRVAYDREPASDEGPDVIDEWVAGQTTQLSPAGSTEPYRLMGTAGGELQDIFFTANEALVPQDLNAGTTDIYDARLDGGFPVPEAATSDSQTPNPIAPSLAAYGSNLTPAGTTLAPLPTNTSHPSEPVTKARKLSMALEQCKKKSKRKRANCEAKARKSYGRKTKAEKNSTKTNSGKGDK
ncbi:MAG TPA: hypothetical protein VIH71_02260 [Solirubrobacteraceae bacterium]